MCAQSIMDYEKAQCLAILLTYLQVYTQNKAGITPHIYESLFVYEIVTTLFTGQWPHQ